MRGRRNWKDEGTAAALAWGARRGGVTLLTVRSGGVARALECLPPEAAERVRVISMDGDPVPLPMCPGGAAAEGEVCLRAMSRLFSRHLGLTDRMEGLRWERWFRVFAGASAALFGAYASPETIRGLCADSRTAWLAAKNLEAGHPSLAQAVREYAGGGVPREWTEALAGLTDGPWLRRSLGLGADPLELPVALASRTVTLVDLGSAADGAEASLWGEILLLRLWTAARAGRGPEHTVIVEDPALEESPLLSEMESRGRALGLRVVCRPGPALAGTRKTGKAAAAEIVARSRRILSEPWRNRVILRAGEIGALLKAAPDPEELERRLGKWYASGCPRGEWVPVRRGSWQAAWVRYQLTGAETPAPTAPDLPLFEDAWGDDGLDGEDPDWDIPYDDGEEE